jgi:hypothetical protein
LKNVEAINRKKLKVNSASFWFYYLVGTFEHKKPKIIASDE